AYLPYIALFLSVGYHFNTSIALAFGLPLDPKAADEGEKLLSASLATIESLWLEVEGDGPFLLGNSQPSIADIALVCEIIQLEVRNANLYI
ncbi:UNVERIFIED_CONTAM: Glutathione S-transferase T1, partial [Sesamum latifolium]